MRGMVNGVGPLSSMTGYATVSGAADGIAWTWEVRAVNARGLDLRLRLPDGCGALDADLRQAVPASVSRGAVTLGLKLDRDATTAPADLDPAAMSAALTQIAQVQAAAARLGLTLAPTSAAEVLTLRAVADGAGARAALPLAAMRAGIAPMIAALIDMRRAEGAAIGAVLLGHLNRIADLVAAAGPAAAARAELQATRLTAALAALRATADAPDEGRIAQELALIAVKSDVAEELDRLRAHVTAARDLLAKGGPVGRKLDFLMQEFNREANTLCAKSGDADLTAIGLDLKLAIDQMREQVQNLE